MKHIIETFKQSFKEHGDTPSGVQWPKGRQELRFQHLTQMISDETCTLLDFGCGLAHAHPFLNTHFPNIHYSGVDINPEFIAHDSSKYPESTFYQIERVDEIDTSYDYIIASGVFNILYDEDVSVHQSMVYEIVSHLFSKTNDALAIDFMTDQIDFKSETSFHQNPLVFTEWARKSLTRRFQVDASYMPFEYTVILYKHTRFDSTNIYS